MKAGVNDHHTMDNAKILWVDDEIDFLKPHILFLEGKGYVVETANNGQDAIDLVAENHYDIIFLDENMPGISGLEALQQIKETRPSLPVIMITKSEEESIMEEAIGSKISDYLIKPVNPMQILLSVKKNLDTKRLVTEKATSNYQQEFRQIGMRLNERLEYDDWTDLYRKLVHYELELSNSNDESMMEILAMQKRDANSQFCKFVEDNYTYWLNHPDDEYTPALSHNILKNRVIPALEKGPVYLVVIDNLRWDQWRVIRPVINDYFRIVEEDMYYSILPTATQYARNALFSGLMPSDMEKKHPQWWLNDHEEGGKNQFEKEFLGAQLKRLNKDKVSFSYNKITNLTKGKKLVDNFANLKDNDLNVVVYNFVDMLSHARTDMEVIRELADDEEAYRSLTLSWFNNSPLFEIIKKMAAQKARVIITTDHGTVRVSEPTKVIGDRNTNTNLRYKQGKNLQFDPKDSLVIDKPEEALLPRTNVSQKFLFAKEDRFFAYPNNYNHYVKYYRDTFQHGGISLEEMLIPFVELEAR